MKENLRQHLFLQQLDVIEFDIESGSILFLKFFPTLVGSLLLVDSSVLIKISSFLKGRFIYIID